MKFKWDVGYGNFKKCVNVNYIFNKKWNLMFRKNGIIFFRTFYMKA